MNLNFVQFSTGNGYYRCQNALLQDLEFCKILKIQVEQRLRMYTEVKIEPQSGIPKEKAVEILMEITSLATMVTMNYAKRKHLFASRDKRE